MLNKHRRSTGNTIIEVLVATAIVGVILTALAYSLGQSVKNSAQAEYRQIATRYAQDGMEFLRQQRTALQWQSFYDRLPGASSDEYCLTSLTLPASVSGYTFGAPPTNCGISHASPPVTMYRTFLVTAKTTGTSGSVQVTVRVRWLDGTEYRTTSLTQTFRDY